MKAREFLLNTIKALLKSACLTAAFGSLLTVAAPQAASTSFNDLSVRFQPA